MSRNRASFHTILAIVGLAAAAVSRAAAADDSSMSMWTGESYAYFNSQDYRLGAFNVARAPQTDTQLAARRPLIGEPMIDVDHPAMGTHAAATTTRPAHVTLPSPFRDDTGQ
jgi:hypothetical protein